MSYSLTHLGATTYKEHLRLQYRAQVNAETLQAPVEQALSAQAQQICGTLERSFGQLNRSLDQVKAELSRGNDLLDWGFSSMLSRLGGMSSTLDEILELEKNQTKTKAYEHYEEAQEAFQKELYPESLRAVTKAIEGIEGAEGGYALEWRFHYLRGLIYLGSANPEHIEIMDLQKAEANFLNAFRYSKSESTADAARALVNAGWAAYCLAARPDGIDAQVLTRADAHFSKACELQVESPNANYNRAKSLIALGDVDAAMTHLKKALLQSKLFLTMLANETAFCDHQSNVEEALEATRTALAASVTKTATQQLTVIAKTVEQREFTTAFDAHGAVKGLTKDNEALVALQEFSHNAKLMPLLTLWSFVDDPDRLRREIEAQLARAADVRQDALNRIEDLLEIKTAVRRISQAPTFDVWLSTLLWGPFIWFGVSGFHWAFTEDFLSLTSYAVLLLGAVVVTFIWAKVHFTPSPNASLDHGGTYGTGLRDTLKRLGGDSGSSINQLRKLASNEQIPALRRSASAETGQDLAPVEILGRAQAGA